MSLFNNTRARLTRRGFPIRAYIGSNGSGKSACAVYDLLPSLEAGRHVLSTVRLLDYESPRPCDDGNCPCLKSDEKRHKAAHELYVPWTRWQQLADAEHLDVFADEITGVASGREWSSLPAPIANLLCQLRRRDVTLSWTAPSWSFGDSILKRTSQAATICSGLLPVTGVDSSGGGRVWRNNRLFRWMTYDAMLLSDLEAGKREKLRQMAFALQWGPGHPMFLAYDTWDAVESVGANVDGSSGACMVCNRQKRRETCDCDAPVAGRRSLAGSSRRGSVETHQHGMALGMLDA